MPLFLSLITLANLVENCSLLSGEERKREMISNSTRLLLPFIPAASTFEKVLVKWNPCFIYSETCLSLHFYSLVSIIVYCHKLSTLKSASSSISLSLAFTFDTFVSTENGSFTLTSQLLERTILSAKLAYSVLGEFQIFLLIWSRNKFYPRQKTPFIR